MARTLGKSGQMLRVRVDLKKPEGPGKNPSAQFPTHQFRPRRLITAQRIICGLRAKRIEELLTSYKTECSAGIEAIVRRSQ